MKARLPFSDKVLPYFFIALAACVFVSIWRLPFVATTDKVGPKLYPWLLSILLVVFSGALLMGYESKHKKAKITSRAFLRGFLPMTLMCVVYVFTMIPLGFLTSTTAFLMGLFYQLGERKLWRNILVAVCCSVGTYLLFATAMGILIPAFPWSEY